MPRHKLTATRARSAGPGWHGDGDGLWLRVGKTGSRSWVFVVIRAGVRRELGLGAFGSVTLAQARVRADEIRNIIARGGDPMAERRAKAKLGRSFGAMADELFAVKSATFRSAQHGRLWQSSIATYAKPLLRIPVGEVSTDDVIKVLRPIWTEKAATASRVRGRIESILNYAASLGLRSGPNPAAWRGHLDSLLGAPQAAPRHHPAMPYGTIPQFWATLAAAPEPGRGRSAHHPFPPDPTRR